MAYHKLGQWDEARERFESPVHLYPNSASVRYHFGLALEDRGHLDKARQSYDMTLQCRPKYTLARQRLDELNPKPPAEELVSPPPKSSVVEPGVLPPESEIQLVDVEYLGGDAPGRGGCRADWTMGRGPRAIRVSGPPWTAPRWL